jgi:hypothetical protein
MVLQMHHDPCDGWVYVHSVQFCSSQSLVWGSVRSGGATRCAVAAAGPAGVASSLVTDLVVLGDLDGLFDAFEVDSDDPGVVRGHPVAGGRHSVRGADASVASVAAAASGRGGVLFLFKQDLADLL